ncbi:MAG TPA: AAA family ATPase [Polyangia bacterium]
MFLTNPAPSTFIHRVQVKNYRSIAACDVQLGALTFLVGQNGSGKSNFLDALRLTADALVQTLDHALRDRGGIAEVRRRSGGHPTHFGIRLDFSLPDGQAGHYAFEVGARQGGSFVVRVEECGVGSHSYRVEDGNVVRSSMATLPAASEDRLYLVTASGIAEFRAVYDALSMMGFYSLNPAAVRALQTPDRGEILKRDGANLASVVERIAHANGGALQQRIEEYLAQVVPGIEGVETKKFGHMETIEFRQRVQGADKPWRFPAINMSDGTLRALGILVALFQKPERGRIPLVGIEEPEAALHPAAAGVLRDCLREASRNTQVIVTSHSPDLLDDRDLPEDFLLAVVSELGTTHIGRVDEVTRSALREHLFTAGELLRSDQLRPGDTARRTPEQLRLFDGSAP